MEAKFIVDPAQKSAGAVKAPKFGESAIDLSFLRPSPGLSSEERWRIIATVSSVITALVALAVAVYFARPVLLPIASALVLRRAARARRRDAQET